MILNKTESDRLIKEKGLNRIEEGHFKGSSNTLDEDVLEYLDRTRYKYYNIRDKSYSNGMFRYKLTRDEIIAIDKNYDKFAIYESLAEADDRLILQGEIEINKDFELWASLSDVKNIPNRIAMKEPKFILEIDLKESKEPNIRGLKGVIDYIISKELIGMVVEFSLFEIPVGINRENIIIWELRNY